MDLEILGVTIMDQTGGVLRCARCGLIFDMEPKEIGRSQIQPWLCILCGDDSQITPTEEDLLQEMIEPF